MDLLIFIIILCIAIPILGNVAGLFIGLALWYFKYVARFWYIAAPVLLLSLLLPHWFFTALVFYVVWFICFHFTESKSNV